MEINLEVGTHIPDWLSVYFLFSWILVNLSYPILEFLKPNFLGVVLSGKLLMGIK